MDKANRLLHQIKQNKCIQQVTSNSIVRQFLQSQYTRNLVVLLILTISTLTISHVSNFVNVQTSLMMEREIATKAYEVYFDGEYVGQIRDKSVVESVLEEIRWTIERTSDSEIVVSNRIDYVASHAEDEELTSRIQLKRGIESNIAYNVIAYGIQVDGEMIGILHCLGDAERLLEEIKEPYLELLEEDQILDLNFSEKVEIVQTEVSGFEVDDYNTLLAFLQKGTTEEKIHVVEQGESLWGIAHRHNLSVEELMEANKDKNPELIHPGDELSLIVPKPYISVQTIEVAVFEERIPFETEYEYVSWMYNDEFSTKSAGKNGIRQVEAYVVRENGIEISREVLSEEIIEEPVARVMYNGTQEPPPKKGTGTFINPLPAGSVTSRYGARWGGFHYGLDIAARTGTPIKAADGGEVIFSGWFGDYGYMVEIDHGGGFTTRYAHCSQLHVSVGEKVYQGKTIASVGNTGYSTGPHVHFEVRKYGSTVNPEAYIGTTYR